MFLELLAVGVEAERDAPGASMGEPPAAYERKEKRA
jgi:hypothetical protein